MRNVHRLKTEVNKIVNDAYVFNYVKNSDVKDLFEITVFDSLRALETRSEGTLIFSKKKTGVMPYSPAAGRLFNVDEFEKAVLAHSAYA